MPYHRKVLEISPRQWRIHLRHYLDSKSGPERRKIIYILAIDLDVDESTIRKALRRANKGGVIPSPNCIAPSRFRGTKRLCQNKYQELGNPRTSLRLRRKLLKKETASATDACAGNPNASTNIIDLCHSDWDEPDATRIHALAAKRSPIVIDLSSDDPDEAPSGSHQTIPSKVQDGADLSPAKDKTVHQFLVSISLAHLVPVFRELGYSTPDDLRLLRQCPTKTRKSVLKAIQKDGRINLRDWNILHASLHDDGM